MYVALEVSRKDQRDSDFQSFSLWGRFDASAPAHFIHLTKWSKKSNQMQSMFDTMKMFLNLWVLFSPSYSKNRFRKHMTCNSRLSRLFAD